MLEKITRFVPILAFLPLVAACGPADEIADDTDPDEIDLFGTTEQAVVDCGGDDSNALAASLAVAIANELGRWDVATDFELKGDKLELSPTGTLRCNGKCANITALLRLQDDVSRVVTNHDPGAYRQKLGGWYQNQRARLTALVNDMLTLDKGVFRFRNKNSGRYLTVENGSTAEGALIRQRFFPPQPGADQWRVVLENTKHRFMNVRSGKCLALFQDSATINMSLVQRTCSSSDAAQHFDFAQVWDFYAISTKHKKSLAVQAAAWSDDAPVVQDNWNLGNAAALWFGEPVGNSAGMLNNVAPAMYYLKDRGSARAIGVDDASMADNALVETGNYVSSEDRFHWYVTKINNTVYGNNYQLVNRRSGKCMALLVDNATSRIAQKTCANVNSQLFYFVPTGDGTYALYTSWGQAVQIEGNASGSDVPLVQAAGDWAYSQQFYLTPILAGEPHRLTYSHKATGAACGDYYWYDITQPNGWPLRDPGASFVQLIFAGGKETRTGADVNPFIAHQVNGNRVAIDPTYGLNETVSSSSGICSAACTKITSAAVTGACCSCEGKTKKYVKSAWNSATYLCQ